LFSGLVDEKTFRNFALRNLYQKHSLLETSLFKIEFEMVLPARLPIKKQTLDKTLYRLAR